MTMRPQRARIPFISAIWHSAGNRFISVRRISSGSVIERTHLNWQYRPYRESTSPENMQPQRSFTDSSRSACIRGSLLLSGRRRDQEEIVFVPVRRRSHGRALRRFAEGREVRGGRAPDRCTTPHYVPDDVSGYTVTPDGSVTTDCPEYSSRRDGCSCQPSVYAILHPAGHGNGADVVAPAD